MAAGGLLDQDHAQDLGGPSAVSGRWARSRVDPGQSPWERVEALLAERIAGDATAKWEKELTEAGIASAEVCTDPGTLPRDPKLANLFAPLGAGASVPRPPWWFLS